MIDPCDEIEGAFAKLAAMMVGLDTGLTALERACERQPGATAETQLDVVRTIVKALRGRYEDAGMEFGATIRANLPLLSVDSDTRH